MQHYINRVEPCVNEAKVLVRELKTRLADTRNRRLITVFTALADNDPSIGLLAYYIWRKRAHRQV
jgi:hypothetical protein